MNRSDIQNIESRHIIYSLKEKMKDRMAHGKTKRSFDILNGVPGIIVL